MSERWNSLSPRTRRLIIAAAAGEGAMKLVALRDLLHRPGDQVRGPKWLWAVSLVVVGSAGALPAAYLRFGRR
jgi:hypothetical protein